MRRVLIAGLLAGCSSPPSEITVHTGRPFLAAIDRGQGWEVLPDQMDLVFEVDGPFALASACGSVDYVEVIVWMATAADHDEWTMPCRAEPGVYHDVTVTQTPPYGEGISVSFAGYSLGRTEWRGDVLEQTTDLLAVETTGDRRFILRRDFEIDRPRLWEIDMERDGRPLATHPIVHDLSAESIESQVCVWMNGVAMTIGDRDDTPTLGRVMPPEVLRDSDLQELYVLERFDPFESLEPQTRWAGGPIGDGPFPALLPDPISEPIFRLSDGVPSVEYGDDRRWTSSSLRLEVYTPTDSLSHVWYARAWPGWVASAEPGELELPEVTASPGWDRDWELRPGTRATLHLTGDGKYTEYAGVIYRGNLSSP